MCSPCKEVKTYSQHIRNGPILGVKHPEFGRLQACLSKAASWIVFHATSAQSAPSQQTKGKKRSTTQICSRSSIICFCMLTSVCMLWSWQAWLRSFDDDIDHDDVDDDGDADSTRQPG
eukprot:1158075-Pelagomonas_calceolata.AAC.2